MENQPVLEFQRADLLPDAPGQAALRGVNLRLLPGELARVQVEPGNERLPLADAAGGLLLPAAGAVRFLGADWATLPPDRAPGQRARIGRVFDGQGWISNLNVLENVTLAQRHHTRRPLPEILAEARELAQAFGLPAVPAARPALVPPRDLRRAEWVRACLGRPALLLLERPLDGVAAEHAPRLARAVAAALEHGAAALWTHAAGEPAPAGVKSLQFYMRGDRMVTS